MERSANRERYRRLHRRPGITLRSIRATKKYEGSGTPEKQGHDRRILRCGARPFGARTLDGVPPRLSPQGIIPSQRLSFRPGFLGRGLNGRYPPSPVPVQGSTSHPGRNAGRHDAQAARKQAANPPAGTALAPMTRCASAPGPSRSAQFSDITVGIGREALSRYRWFKIEDGAFFYALALATPSDAVSGTCARG